MSIGSPPAVALIAGATASGKSSLAMALAAERPATIVNADSAQVYADLRVLSARPSAPDEAVTPHRLFGDIDGASAFSAAQWASAAADAIDEAHESGRLPILVGGTGLYLRTLLDGIAPVPSIDAAVRAAVRLLPVADAHAALAVEDPEAAARLGQRDTARVARALEVVRSTGRPLSSWQAERHGGIADRIALVPLLLVPDRNWLGERVAARFEAMLDDGAADEVERLIARRLSPDLPVMRAIGVREIAGWLAGDWSREEAIARAVLATRRYAKRQDTWFRNQPPAHWPREIRPPDARMLDELLSRLAAVATAR